MSQVGSAGELIPADGLLEHGCGSKIERMTIVSRALTRYHDDGNTGQGWTGPKRRRKVESVAVRTEKVLNDQVDLLVTKFR